MCLGRIALVLVALASNCLFLEAFKPGVASLLPAALKYGRSGCSHVPSRLNMARDKFDRSKPHLNIGTIGHVGRKL